MKRIGEILVAIGKRDTEGEWDGSEYLDLK